MSEYPAGLPSYPIEYWHPMFGVMSIEEAIRRGLVKVEGYTPVEGYIPVKSKWMQEREATSPFNIEIKEK
jgi:hypothetical protein